MRAANPGGSGSGRLGGLLVASFTLTIASFVLAAAITGLRAEGIVAAANSIMNDAFPTIRCLAHGRTEIRRISVAIDRLTFAALDGSADADAASALRDAREAFERQWTQCVALPAYPREPSVQRNVTARAAEMNASIDRVVRRTQRGDAKGAVDELLLRTQPAIERLDDSVVAEIDLNAVELAELGAKIRHIKASSDRILIGLNVISALLAASAAFAMTRVLRKFTALMESRISILEQFATSLAHDIRGPLASVSLALELMKRDPKQRESASALGRATRSLQRVVQLVDGLLVFAAAGAPPKQGAEADPGAILGSVLDQMLPLAEERDIALSMDPPENSTLVACSPGVLISVVSNLVANAIKYMSDSAVRRVAVRTLDLGPVLRFEVSDTGPGIPSDMSERIFDPYVRGGEATDVPGFGLGLATVRRLIEAHEGTVGVRPNEGPGSTFWLELPKARAKTS
jgi:signal transduction histidine kinase